MDHVSLLANLQIFRPQWNNTLRHCVSRKQFLGDFGWKCSFYSALHHLLADVRDN